jgi:hypothetical protein
MARKPPQFEGSKADNRMDKRGAKKAGMSAAKFEGSAADKKMDAKGQAAMNKRFGRGK